MENINNFLSNNAKYIKLSKPLTAARVCETAREGANGRFSVVSFKQGLLTLGVTDPTAGTNLRFIEPEIIEEINTKLGQKMVEKLMFKVIGC